MRAPTAANRGRIIQTSGGAANGISVPSTAYTINTNYNDTYPIFRFATPVLSVWGCGDSIMQGNATTMIADGYSTYVSRACSDVMTQTGIPVAYANLGANSQNAAYYWAQTKALLALGVPPPSVLVIGPASVNDAGSTPTQATIDAQVALAFDIISTAKQYSIQHIIWVPIMPNENLTNVSTTFYDDKRKAANATIKALAASSGIQWLDLLPPLGNGASPELWIPAYRLDTFHPNEVGHESVLAPALVTALRRIVGA
jgi:lysophospholipase L1-like esterase